jgi:hypothetical protein
MNKTPTSDVLIVHTYLGIGPTTNLCAMILDRGGFSSRNGTIGGIEPGLFGQMLDCLQRHFLGTVGKAALGLKKLKQHHKTEAGGTGLGEQQHTFWETLASSVPPTPRCCESAS